MNGRLWKVKSSPRHYKGVCVPTFKHEMYSHLHDEYRATAARGKSATFRRLQLQEEMSAAHANGLAWGSPSCEA
jgi:hypothetical protein